MEFTARVTHGEPQDLLLSSAAMPCWPLLGRLSWPLLASPWSTGQILCLSGLDPPAFSAQESSVW